MIIYLYHKRHKITGLNYFGKTINDPWIYLGSGSYWKQHLKKHGYDIETLQVWKFDNIIECSKFAIQFSIDNDIVNSKKWANLCIEDGYTGGDKLTFMNEERYKEICNNRSKIQIELWKSRDKNFHSIAISEVWKKRNKEDNKKIFSKISNTIKNKTIKEKLLILEKYRNTVSKRNKIFCPHCNVSGTSKSNMNRYHFDNCLKNPQSLPRKPLLKLTCEFCNKNVDPGNYKKYHGDLCKFKDGNK